MSDLINHPDHYTQGGIECVSAIKASMSAEAFRGYCQGNVLKYVWRHKFKGGITDLEKAQVYLLWMMKSIQESDN